VPCFAEDRSLAPRIASSPSAPENHVLASYTAISISALLAGRAHRGRGAEDIAAAPNAFDFARAARVHLKGPARASCTGQRSSNRSSDKDIRRLDQSSFVTLPDR
jgi:hypothetical protein